MRNKNWSAGTRIRFKTGIAMVLTACMVMGTVSPLCVHAEEFDGAVAETTSESVSTEPDTILTEVSGDDIVEDDILEEGIVENDIAEEILLGEDSLDCLDEPGLEREDPDGEQDGDFRYKLIDSRYTITKYTGSATELTIPTELGGKKITAIAEGAFQDNATIKNLTIPEGIVEIGGAAFANCSALESLNLPGSLTECGYSSVYYINGIFGNTSGPFGCCDKLKTVTFGSGLTSIPNNLFQLCTGLESITIPDSVKTIGKNAFESCTSLKEITIPGNVKTIDRWAFQSDTSLTKVVINEGVEKIEEAAFDGCSALKEAKLADTITYLGGAAFAGCTALETVNIPASLTECGNANVVYLNAIFGNYAGPFGCCDKLKTVTFGSGLTSIPANLFRLCTGLESVTIPDSVKTIGKNAFESCTSLKEITIPGSVKTIDRWAFQSDTSLTKVVINEGVEKIEEAAFDGCSALKEAKLADTITYLGGAAFAGCTALETVNIPASLTECGDANVVYLNAIFGNYAGPFGCCDKLKTVTFGKGLASIPANLFRLCTGLETVTLPSSVKSIGNYAFADCTSLKKLGIPGSVTAIGNKNAIEGSTSLVIYGLDKSAAQEYATQNNIKFEVDDSLGAGSDTGTDNSNAVYTITLDGRNNKSVQTVTVKSGNQLPKPETPVLEGYIFTGWFCEDACQNQYDFAKTSVKADLTLYAGWAADAAYKGVPAADVRASGKKSFWIAKISAYTYTGAAIKPEPQVYDGDTKLVPGEDYTVKYSNNKKAGKATVQVKGKGRYKGKFTLKTTFTIKKRKISESYVTKTFVNTYDKPSKKKNPKLSFKAVSGTKTLKKDTDYKITVYNANGKKVSSYYKAGTYVARITGKGNFDSKDYCELSFTVE